MHKKPVATPGLIALGVSLGVGAHVIDQSRGEPWWSARVAYAADAELAQRALLKGSRQLAGSRQTSGASGSTAAPFDAEVDPRPPILSVLDDSQEQPQALGFLTGLNLPGIPVPAHPAVEKYLNFYTADPAGSGAFRSWLQRSGRYDRMIESALRKHRVPTDLKAVVFIESGFVPTAVSPAGAAGMWQFMRGTAELYDLAVEKYYDQRLDPIPSSNAGAKHLADLYAAMDDWPLALAAYNYGRGNVEARLAEAHATTFWDLLDTDGLLPKETQKYVPRVLAVAVILANLEHYGLDKVRLAPAAPRTTRYEPPLGVPITMLARAAGTSVKQLLELNPQLARGELPGAGDPVTVNVKSEWYGRTRAMLPLLQEQGAKRRDLEVSHDFDWGADEL